MAFELPGLGRLFLSAATPSFWRDALARSKALSIKLKVCPPHLISIFALHESPSHGLSIFIKQPHKLRHQHPQVSVKEMH